MEVEPPGQTVELVALTERDAAGGCTTETVAVCVSCTLPLHGDVLVARRLKVVVELSEPVEKVSVPPVPTWAGTPGTGEMPLRS